MTRRNRRRLTVATLDAAWWAWWEAGGAGDGAAAKAAARRRGDPEPAEHIEPHRCTWEGGKYRIQPVEEPATESEE